jgi:alkaline phosphatase
MNRFFINRSAILSVIFLLSFISILSAQKPRNVIVFIGDGYGVAPKTAARMALGQGQDGARFSDDPNFRLMQADNLRYNTVVTTHSMNSWITDSAPGATVYASGKKGKVNNEAIAFNMDSNTPVETILENAKKEGYAVGIVSTTRITHATPADFASHIWNRDIEDVIATQYLSASQDDYRSLYGTKYDSLNKHWVLPMPKRGVEVDVILGGGSRHFLPRTVASANSNVLDSKGAVILDATGAAVKIGGNRSDDLDLVNIAKTRGFKYVNSRDALMNIDLSQFTSTNNAKLLGLFATSMMDFEQDRQLSYQWEPSLADMTQIAIEILKRKGGSKGFFLMVEGGRIDHLEHANAGGISFAAGSTTMSISADKETFTPEAVYTTPTAPVTPGIYGSDYLIKEVLAFDYSIGKGRELLKDNSSETLIFSTADHECGGMAIVGLHDEADLQNNASKIRTYAATPAQTAASGGGTNANPIGLTPGARWYPQYTMYDFQGYKFPKPTNATANRIVIAYGSNPVVNGNGTKLGSTPGNHTPADIWVGADDNVNGSFASRVTGRGLLDNTDLTPIMKDFLKLDKFQLYAPKLSISNTTIDKEYCRFGFVTYKITVKNEDVYAADNTEINVPLPANTAYNSANATSGFYSQYCSGGTKCEKWTIPSLAAGQSAELSLRVFTLTNTGNLATTAMITTENLAANGGRVTVSIPHATNCSSNNLKSSDTGNTLESIKAYPNPTNDKLNVEFESKLEGKGTLNMYDSKGSVILSRAIELNKGFNNFNIETAKMTSGNYYLIIQGDNWVSEAQTIVKL